MYYGQRYVPKILEVAEQAKSFGIDVQIAIIVRDQNINAEQQRRVRGEVTTPIAQKYYYDILLSSEFPVHFLDHEAFFLHKEHYIDWLGKVVGFPVVTDRDQLMKFIERDANHKYVQGIEHHWLDDEIHAGCQPNRSERLNNV